MQFALYDFAATVPNDWNVYLDRKSSYEAGHVRFTTPSRTNVDIVWAKLDEYKKRFPSVDAFLENYFDTMRKNRNVKTFEPTKGIERTTDEHTFLPHEFAYKHKAQLSRAFSQRIVGVALYDQHSDRFGIIYSRWDPDKENPEEPAIRDAVKSFDCLCNKGTKLS